MSVGLQNFRLGLGAASLYPVSASARQAPSQCFSQSHIV
ncbi:hypothetical protein [Sporisorium scitamineum]|uniref:Uncharacterized protein n=1 Tax=Sporisorium scitamineum TaxID=49012 RepID=A0A0F7S1S4_9BASI|nr:hypothetical protein [Sporisorium scitamineum]